MRVCMQQPRYLQQGILNLLHDLALWDQAPLQKKGKIKIKILNISLYAFAVFASNRKI